MYINTLRYFHLNDFKVSMPYLPIYQTTMLIGYGKDQVVYKLNSYIIFKAWTTFKKGNLLSAVLISALMKTYCRFLIKRQCEFMKGSIRIFFLVFFSHFRTIGTLNKSGRSWFSISQYDKINWNHKVEFFYK